MFQIIALLHNPSSRQLQLKNGWLDILIQDFLLESRIYHSTDYDKSFRSRSSKAVPERHIITIIFHCWYDIHSFSKMLCWFYARCNETQTLQKLNISQSLGGHKDVSGKREGGFFGQQWFSMGTPVDVIFAQPLSYC